MEREAKLDEMLEQYGELEGEFRERIKAKMEVLQAEIDQLAKQLFDLREPWGDLQADLKARREAFEASGKGAYRAEQPDAKKRKPYRAWLIGSFVTFAILAKRATLNRSEITPIAGDSACFCGRD